jgi:putative transposase
MRDRFNPDLNHRRSTRLQRYAYAQTGPYFITICTARRAHLFGDIMDGVMRLNDQGQIVEAEWLRTLDVRASVALDMFVVMPNHLHGIVVITSGECADVGRMQYAPKCICPKHAPDNTSNRLWGVIAPGDA